MLTQTVDYHDGDNSLADTWYIERCSVGKSLTRNL